MMNNNLKYLEYNTEAFLADQKFKDWVVNPNVDSEHYWRSFLQQYPDQAHDIFLAKRIILGLNFPAPPESKDYSHEDLEDLIQEVFKSFEIDTNSRNLLNIDIYTFWNRFNWVLRAASVLLFGISAGIFWLLLINSFKSIESSILVTEIVKSTEKGQKLTIHLEDGTFIKLNSDSKLIYPKHFGSVRTVILDGQAYFEVMEDPDRPFEVITQGIKTTVLGTKFGINHDSESNLIKVALLEGKVKVEAEDMQGEYLEPHILTPMEMITFSSEEGKFKEGKFDYKTFFGWKDDLLVFKNDGFSDVLKKLEDWYGVKFIVQKEISVDKDFTGEYHNEILKNILVGIGYTFEFKYEINNKTVIIK